jgi:hypothetical protein
MFIQSFLVCLMPSCTAASNVLGRTCELGIDLGFLGLRKNLPIQCQTNLPALWHRCNLTMIQQTFESPLKRIASGWWWHQGNQLIVSIYHLFRESENILKIWTHHLIIWTHHFFIESTDWKYVRTIKLIWSNLDRPTHLQTSNVYSHPFGHLWPQPAG